MRSISYATRNVTLAVLIIAVCLLALAQFLPPLLIPAASELPPVNTRFVACATAGEERRVSCQRITAAVDTSSPLMVFDALERSGAECSEVAGDLGRMHWVIDHRLPAYSDKLRGCDGTFFSAVITSMLDAGVRSSSIEQLAGWCPEGVGGCTELVVDALAANPAARSWFCSLITDEVACATTVVSAPDPRAGDLPLAGSRLGPR